MDFLSVWRHSLRKAVSKLKALGFRKATCVLSGFCVDFSSWPPGQVSAAFVYFSPGSWLVCCFIKNPSLDALDLGGPSHSRGLDSAP